MKVMSKFFYVSSDGAMIDGHSHIPEFCFIEIVKNGHTFLKKVTHDEWMKHNKLIMRDDSLFDLENKKMTLRIAKINAAFDPNNKYYQQQLVTAQKEFDNLKS